MSVIRDYIHPTIGCRIIVRDDDVAGAEEQKLLRRQLMRIGCDISRRVWREEQSETEAGRKKGGEPVAQPAYGADCTQAVRAGL